MSHSHVLTADWLTLGDAQQFFKSQATLTLPDVVRQRIEDCYQFVQQKVNSSDRLIYGINTGFGSLCNVRINPQELENLQHNLIMSHACGVGEEVPSEIVRLMLLLKIKNLSFGLSGVQLITAERMAAMYNYGILPVVYQLGSLGASGDLAPLAHLSLPLIGMGEVRYKGERMPSLQALQNVDLQPIQLAMKEGLALLNGTQFCLSYGLASWWKGERLSRLADLIAAMSIDGFACVLTPYDERLHRIRPHAGQSATAQAIRQWLNDSPLAHSPKSTVQDPYSFRCVPQVHGASKDAIQYVGNVLETELNSVTDNPTVFPDTDAILSGGNFHAQPLALALDFMAMALSELGNISERRVYQLIGGQRGLPPFLTPQSGLHSGLMIAQYTAAGIVNQNKQLCTPTSVDSIVSCNGQEDHVSMAANSATKLYRIVENVERLLAIEFMTAAQALSFRELPTSPALQAIVQQYRERVPVLEADRIISDDIHATIDFLRQLDF